MADLLNLSSTSSIFCSEILMRQMLVRADRRKHLRVLSRAESQSLLRVLCALAMASQMVCMSSSQYPSLFSKFFMNSRYLRQRYLLKGRWSMQVLSSFFAKSKSLQYLTMNQEYQTKMYESSSRSVKNDVSRLSQINLAFSNFLSRISNWIHRLQIQQVGLILATSWYMLRALLATSRSSRSHQQKYRSTLNFRKNSLLLRRMLMTFMYLFVSFYMQWKTYSQWSISSVRAIRLRQQQQDTFSTMPFDRQRRINSCQMSFYSSSSGLPSKQGCLICSSSFNRASLQLIVFRQMALTSSLRCSRCSSTDIELARFLSSLMARALTCVSEMVSNHCRYFSYILSSPTSPRVKIFLKNSNLVFSLTISQYSSQRKRERVSAPTSMMAYCSSSRYFCWLGSISLKLLMYCTQSSQLLGFLRRAVLYSSNLVHWMYSAQYLQLKGKDSRKQPRRSRQLSDWLSMPRYSYHRRYFSPQLQCSISFRKVFKASLIIILYRW